MVFILPTLLISVSLNIPRFLELELVYFNVTDNNNITREVMDFNVTPLRLDTDYIENYIFWTRTVGTGVIPIVFLLITNTAIYLSLKRQRPTDLTTTNNTSDTTVGQDGVVSLVIRQPSVLSEWLGSSYENTEISSMLSEEQISQNRRNLSQSARTLSAIVVMYVVCNLPRLVLNTGEISTVLIGRPPIGLQCYVLIGRELQ